jgi:hypothetical protein
VAGAAEPGGGELGEAGGELGEAGDELGEAGDVGGPALQADNSAETAMSSVTGRRRGRSCMRSRRAIVGTGFIRRSSTEPVRCVHFG